MATKNLTAVPVTTGTMPKLRTASVPKGAKVNLAQTIYEAIQRDFQRPEIQEEYARWKAARTSTH